MCLCLYESMGAEIASSRGRLRGSHSQYYYIYVSTIVYVYRIHILGKNVRWHMIFKFKICAFIKH